MRAKRPIVHQPIRSSRRGKIIEPLFVILALMCLPVLLFGNWFVSAYGNPDQIAATGVSGTTTSSQQERLDAPTGSTTPERDGADNSKDGHQMPTANESIYQAGADHKEHTAPPSAIAANASHERELEQSGYGTDETHEEHDGSHEHEERGGQDLLAGDQGDLHAGADLLDRDNIESPITHAADDNPFPIDDVAVDLESPPDTGMLESLPDSVLMKEKTEGDENDAAADLGLGSLLGNDTLPDAAPDLGADASNEPTSKTNTSDTNAVTESETPGAENDLDLSNLLSSEPPPAAKAKDAIAPVARLWTRKDGRTANAVFVRVETTTNGKAIVVISPPNNAREFKLPVDKLSEADVKYVERILERL